MDNQRYLIYSTTVVALALALALGAALAMGVAMDNPFECKP
jgi:hypothetical protein